VPRKATICNIVTKLSSTGSALAKNDLERHVLTEEKLDEIDARLEASPKKLLDLLSLQCGLEKRTARNGTKLLNLAVFLSTAQQNKDSA
jgi:hypothetical protein